METFDEGADALTAEESWQSIHATMDNVRSSMYVAGMATILLMWGVILAVGYLTMYGVYELAPDFAEQHPWFPAPLWWVLGPVGGVSSGIIGSRASRRLSYGAAGRRAGIRVCLFFVTMVVAMFLILGVAGVLDDPNADGGKTLTASIAAFVALGYILFGIMTRAVIALAGAGFAVVFFVPHYLLGDAALGVTGVLSLVTFGLTFLWIRRTGEW